MYLDKPRSFRHMEGESIRFKTGYARNLEVRCIIELDDDECFCPKKFKSKSPDKSECPAIRERLARHMKDCPGHSNKGSTKNNSRFASKRSADCQTMQLNSTSKRLDKEILTDFYERSLALSPIISMDDKLFNSRCLPCNSKSPTIEIAPKNNIHHARKSIEELYLRKNACNVQDRKESRNDNKVKQTETVILHPRGQYKDTLQAAILQWLSEIPVFPHVDQAAKIVRDNAVNELNEAIYNLSVDINNDDYEENVKTNIHNFLKDLPVWYPCSSKDQKGYKRDLENKLFDRINTLNKELFNASNDKKTYVRNLAHRPKTDSATETDTKIEKLVLNYLSHLAYVETDDWGHPINVHRVKEEVIQLLRPVLKIMSQLGRNKLYLKTELKNILLGTPLVWLRNKENQLEKYAEEITDIILAARTHKPIQNSSNLNDQSCDENALNYQHSDDDVNKYVLTQDIVQLINSATETNNSGHEQELIDMMLDNFDSIRSGNERYAEDEIYEFLISSYDLTKQNASFLAKTIIKKIKSASKGSIDKSCSPIFLPRDRLSKSVLVFVSDHDLSGPGPSSYPVTSTPKKSSPKKEISKLNEEEKKYLRELSKLINAWIDTVPELIHVNEDKNYKEVMVADLAGHLMDEMKLEQYGPDKNFLGTRDNLIKCAVLSWIIKFEEDAFQNMAEDQETSVKYLDNFYSKFLEIPIPVLTKSRHGTRQDQKASKFRRNDSNRSSEFIPEGKDILEDEISIWMNEQPSRIYLNQNNDLRNEMLHNFALKVQDQLKSKKSDEQIKLETKQWLDNILKPNEKNNIDNLAENLKERIIKVPLDETLKANRKRKKRLKNEKVNENINEPIQENANYDTAKYDLNKTLLEFIDMFIEHNYEEDDMLVKGALSELLKSELRRLSPSDKIEMYQNCGPECCSKEMLSDRLQREIHYIKDISDWLKNIPVEKSFNVPGNPNRIEYVTSLAKDICDVETERIQAPKAISYDDYLIDLIRNHLQHLPFLPNKQPTHQNLLELYLKIVNSRNVLNKNENLNNSSGKSGLTIGDFIDEYVRVNGKEIADDPVKLEVYNARIMQEILKMIQTSEPVTSFKEKLANVPLPGDDTVIQFKRKLMYAHEIGDWIKNMPLQTLSDEETTDMITKMISNLADELSQKHTNNIQDDPELIEFITNWILTLPLEPSKEIDISVLVQQLSNRIKRVNEGKYQSLDDSSIVDYNKSISRTKQHNSSTSRSKVGCSGELIVDAIEGWCNTLPIKDQNINIEKEVKDNIAIRLFQKVGDLNLDPRFYDDILYQDLLSDEIDNIFEDLKQYDEVQINKENLKSSLLNAIVEARSIIKEQTAGEQYKQKLEHTIEASIPAPVTRKKIYDPGFEIYKNKLTNMFILENFDHGDDPVKLKYEVKIKDAIDKYFQEAQKRNAVPLSKDEIYNDLYSALFKVPIPNETSVIQEVEEVKLRCEIDGWFEGLPIREAINLNEQLDWDKILAMLAKRIYEIENNDPQPDEKIHREITKWLVKFPLLPGEEKNMEKHAKTLEDRLKSSKNDRKCVPRSQMDKVAQKGKSLKKISRNKNMSIDISQAAGPSGASQMLSSPQPCCVAASTPKKKPGDIILEIVENWCLSLPLSKVEGENDRTIRDNLVTNILKKLSELNTDARVFDDDMLYDEYLNDELERLIRTLPMCCELQRSKDVRKRELISAIRSLKPLIRYERARHDYKKEIKNIIKEMLPEPLDTTVEKAALFKDLVDGIADSFVQYNYNRDDYEGKQEYKNQIRKAILKYFSEINDQSNEDILFKQNKLICELTKIPIPSEAAIKEDVEEIKMKDEVSNFLDDVIPDDNNAVAASKERIKSNLSKRLHDLEKNGHSCANDRTMKEEIVKSLNKANHDVDINKVEDFVSQLKDNEAIRKSPPIRKPDQFEPSVNVSKELKQHGWSGYSFDSILDQPPKDSLQYKSESEKFYTLLPDSQPYPGSPKSPPKTPTNPQAKLLQLGKSYTYHLSGQNLQPPQSPGSMIHYPAEKEPSYSYHTLPDIPGLRPPPEMFDSYIEPRSMIYSGQSSDRPPPGAPRSMTYNSGGQSSGKYPPGTVFDSRFPPRPQTRRQSLDIPSNQGINGPRRQSLQAPLKYDYKAYDDSKNAPPSYRDICVEQPETTGVHMPLPVLAFNDAPKSPPRPKSPPKPQRPVSPTQNRYTVTSPRPMSPVQRQPISPPNAFLSRSSSPMQSQPLSQPNSSQYQPRSPAEIQSLSPVQIIRPTAPPNALSPRPVSPTQNQPFSQPTQLASLFEPSTQPSPPPQSPNILLPAQNMTVSRPMTTQSYQGFQNAIAAVSSPVQIQPPVNTPTSMPQAIEEVGPSQGPVEGTYRMAATPQTLRNPPRKRRRIRSTGEEEEICDCLGKDIRCYPFPSFPFWGYMPYRFSRYCLF